VSPAGSVPERSGGYRVGIDVGGTFTDLLCVTPDGRVLLDKTPTTSADQSRGVMAGLDQLAGAARCPSSTAAPATASSAAATRPTWTPFE